MEFECDQVAKRYEGERFAVKFLNIIAEDPRTIARWRKPLTTGGDDMRNLMDPARMAAGATLGSPMEGAQPVNSEKPKQVEEGDVSAALVILRDEVNLIQKLGDIFASSLDNVMINREGEPKEQVEEEPIPQMKTVVGSIILDQALAVRRLRNRLLNIVSKVSI